MRTTLTWHAQQALLLEAAAEPAESTLRSKGCNDADYRQSGSFIESGTHTLDGLDQNFALKAKELVGLVMPTARCQRRIFQTDPNSVPNAEWDIP